MLHIFHNFYSCNTSTNQWAYQTALCQGEWTMSGANSDIHLNISKLWFVTLENRPDGQAKKAMRLAIVRIFNTNRNKNTDDWKFMKCLLLNMLCRKGNDVLTWFVRFQVLCVNLCLVCIIIIVDCLLPGRYVIPLSRIRHWEPMHFANESIWYKDWRGIVVDWKPIIFLAW